MSKAIKDMGDLQRFEVGYVHPSADEFGDRLAVVWGGSDIGEMGWMVVRYMTDRDFTTPKMFFPVDGDKVDMLGSAIVCVNELAASEGYTL